MWQWPYRLEQRPVVPEAPHHANEGDPEHGEAQQQEDDGWSQEDPFQGLVLLPLHFSVNPHAQDREAKDLQGKHRMEFRFQRGKTEASRETQRWKLFQTAKENPLTSATFSIQSQMVLSALGTSPLLRDALPLAEKGMYNCSVINMALSFKPGFAWFFLSLLCLYLYGLSECFTWPFDGPTLIDTNTPPSQTPPLGRTIPRRTHFTPGLSTELHPNPLTLSSHASTNN